MRTRTRVALLALLTMGLWGSGARGGEPAAPRFYFVGPHLFPLKPTIAGLMPFDMDEDGRTDLLLVDPRASKFHLLLQKGAGDARPRKTSAPAQKEANALEPDRLLIPEEVPINETPLGLVVGGFGGHKAAIAYISDAKELILLARGEGGAWEPVQRHLLDLPSSFAGGFECADLDGNGKQDLVLLTEDSVLVMRQGDDGQFAEPERHPVAKEKSSGLVLGDVNNDGRPDVIYRSPGTRYPLRVRLTRPDGTPGPEYRFRMPMPRHVAVGDLTGDGRNEVVVIESTTNRLKVLRWDVQEHGASEGAEAGALELVPLPQDQKAKLRSFALADVDGNGIPDLVVTEPGAARMALARTERRTGLLPYESFPSLDETTSVAAVQTPDRTTEVVLCSAKEGILGVSRYDARAGRLEYPQPIEVGGEPRALAVGKGPRGKGTFLYCSVRGPTPQGADRGPVELVTLERTRAGYSVVRRQAFGDLKEPAAQLVAVDADGDGSTDLLAFPEYQPPLLLMQDAEGNFDVVSEKPGFHKHLLRGLKPSAVATAPPRRGERPAMFLGSGNLVRAVRYEDGNLVVQDQFSSRNARSSFAALAAVDLDRDGETEILAADLTSEWLAVLRRNEKGVYDVSRNIEIGPFEFVGLATADLDGDGTEEVLIAGQEKVGVLFLGKGGPELRQISSYETDQKETAYAQCVIADLNGDGRNDLLLREVQQHQLEVLYLGPEGEWKRGMRFKVFEGRIFEEGQAQAPEPREVVTADLTGDGLTDVAIIVHDRVVVYPQQGPGP